MLWYNGKIETGTNLPFDLADRGLLLADGLFETLPCFNGRAFMVEAHLDRMLASASRIMLPLNRAWLERAIHELAALDPAQPGVIRLTATRGPGQRGLALPTEPTPFVFATRAPWRPEIAFGTVRLATAAIRRNATSPLATIKSLGYLDNILAFEGAKAAGADDALLLNHTGSVTCTSIANLFVLNDNTLISPPIDDGVLPGIMRQLVLELAPQAGLVGQECSLDPAEILAADCVFTSNSVRFLTRVTLLDGRTLSGDGSPHFSRLADLIRARVAQTCGGFEGFLPPPSSYRPPLTETPE